MWEPAVTGWFSHFNYMTKFSDCKLNAKLINEILRYNNLINSFITSSSSVDYWNAVNLEYTLKNSSTIKITLGAKASFIYIYGENKELITMLGRANYDFDKFCKNVIKLIKKHCTK